MIKRFFKAVWELRALIYLSIFLIICVVDFITGSSTDLLPLILLVSVVSLSSFFVEKIKEARNQQ